MRRESVRSWLGIVIGTLITTPAIGRLVGGLGVLPINLLILAAGLGLLLPSLLLRLDVDDDDVRIWPFRTSVRLENIDWVEAKGSFFASLIAHRVDVPRPTQLTVQPIFPGRAREVADRLNDDVERAKRTS